MGTASRAMRSQEAMWSASFCRMVEWICWASDMVLPLWEPYATTRDTPGIAEEGRERRGEEEKEEKWTKRRREVDVKGRVNHQSPRSCALALATTPSHSSPIPAGVTSWG